MKAKRAKHRGTCSGCGDRYQAGHYIGHGGKRGDFCLQCTREVEAGQAFAQRFARSTQSMLDNAVGFEG